MPRNFDYEGDLEIFPAGYGSNKYTPAFVINYDVDPGQRQTWTDPGYDPSVSVNSVKVVVIGEAVECPDWLEKIILDAVSHETLLEHACEDAI